MGKGFGNVQRAILRLFRERPIEPLSTSEICKYVYEVKRIDKKHRVAVLRALKGLAKTELPNLYRAVMTHERVDDVWYNFKKVPLKGRGRAHAFSPRPR